jgi:hypothetical protein
VRAHNGMGSACVLTQAWWSTAPRGVSCLLLVNADAAGTCPCAVACRCRGPAPGVRSCIKLPCHPFTSGVRQAVAAHGTPCALSALVPLHICAHTDTRHTAAGVPVRVIV